MLHSDCDWRAYRRYVSLSALVILVATMTVAVSNANGSETIELPCPEEEVSTFQITWGDGEVRAMADPDTTARDVVDTKLVDGTSEDYVFTEVDDRSAQPDQSVVVVEDEQNGQTAALLGIEQLDDGSFRTEAVQVCQ